LWNGPRKSRSDLAFAVGNGVQVVIDSLSEGIDYLELGADIEEAPEFGFRVAVGDGSTFISRDRKLGMSMDDCALFLRLAAERRRIPSILHAHALARCASPEQYAAYVRGVASVRQWIAGSFGMTIPVVDLGGGWEGRARGEAAGSTARALACSAVDVLCEDGTPPRRIIFELGRYIVEDAAFGLASVVRAKVLGGQRWLVIDASTNLFIPLPLARFDILPPIEPGPLMRTTVCDGTCSPAGIIVADAMLPEYGEGDLLAILNCGAYTAALTEPFFEPAPPVLWLQDGASIEAVSPAQMRTATRLLQAFPASGGD
jgi:diaminopimelate decarboxylase